MPEIQDQSADSPYIYEEPRKPFSKREKTILSASLVAVGVVAGSQFILPAIANQIAMQSGTGMVEETSNVSDLPDGGMRSQGNVSARWTDANQPENNFFETVGQFSADVASFFGSAAGSTPSEPTQLVTPQPASSSIALPDVATQDWANLSSATPYASNSSGSASGGLASGSRSLTGGSNGSSSWGEDDDRDDNGDRAREDQYDHDDRDDSDEASGDSDRNDDD